MTKRQPIFDINDYLLNGTEVGTMLGYTSETGMRPIIPTQQQPEANDSNVVNPYIVYSFRTVTDTDMWWMHIDEVSYVIWGSSFDQLSEIANEIVDHTRAMDDSAGDLMNYLYARGTDINWRFHYMRLMGSFSPEPALGEAGRLGWLLTFRYGYSPVNGKHIG